MSFSSTKTIGIHQSGLWHIRKSQDREKSYFTGKKERKKERELINITMPVPAFLLSDRRRTNGEEVVDLGVCNSSMPALGFVHTGSFFWERIYTC